MDEEVRKIIAAIDMVLYHHPKHPWTFLCVGTLPRLSVSRVYGPDRRRLHGPDVRLGSGRRCKMGFRPFGCGGAARDVRHRRRGGQRRLLSAVPSGSRLGHPAPYSASARPSYHNWVHIVGALFAYPRSLKASVVSTPGYRLVTPAVLTAYALRRTGGYGQLIKGVQEDSLSFQVFLVTPSPPTESFLKILSLKGK